LLAAGAHDDALRVLHYLEATQEADGHWAQNMWLDGRPYWNGLQMDETAFPILLVDLLRRESPRCFGDSRRWWPMVRKAAAFIVANGPVTQQDRWEEDGGYSPFTLAAEISALLSAADLAQSMGQSAARRIPAPECRHLERQHRTLDVRREQRSRPSGRGRWLLRPHRAAGWRRSGFAAAGICSHQEPRHQQLECAAVEIVSPDALALVRFGLRAPDDPRMLNTIKVVDELLRVKLPQGPGWYRYNCDGYGEHEDGSPFDGTGSAVHGRCWPVSEPTTNWPLDAPPPPRPCWA
jgi:glucoamylase